MKNYHCSDDKCEGPTKAEKHPFKTICKFIIPSLYGFYQNQPSPTTDHRPTDHLHLTRRPIDSGRLSLFYFKRKDQMLNMFCILQFLKTFILITE